MNPCKHNQLLKVNNNIKVVKVVKMLTEKEIKYLRAQKLAKLESASFGYGSDHSMVSYELDGEKLVIPSVDVKKSLNHKLINNGKEKVTIEIDNSELSSTKPEKKLKVSGTAKLVEREGGFGPGLYIEITPRKKFSWGINK